MKKTGILRFCLPLGMLAVLFYLLHTFLGNLWWSAYSPLSTDISSLTATGAPNAHVLRFFTTGYHACLVVFLAAMLGLSGAAHTRQAQAGYLLWLLMALISWFGYWFFPLESAPGSSNAMHLAVTGVVVVLSLTGGFLIGLGYRRRAETGRMSLVVLFLTALMLAGGLLMALSRALGWNILGLCERLVIYSLLGQFFLLSAFHTKNWRRITTGG